MPEHTSRRSIAGFIACGLLALLYWPLLVGQIPAFRDTYHFYYPLWVWLDSQAVQGNYFPQFNPHDGTGTNLVGEATTALFYPGRVLLCLPGLGLTQRIAIYLMAHTALAAGGAAYAARRANLSQPATLLAAVSYSLSCPVFFQLTNPIFLVGAAWLPWALAECAVIARSGTAREDTDQKHETKTRWWLWIAATSLMLLGGDAQSTVNTGLVTCLAIGVALFRGRSFQQLRQHLARLSLATLAVAGLTAVQWLPTWHWLQHSTTTPPPVAAALTPAAMEHDQVPRLLRAKVAPSNDGEGEGEGQFKMPSSRGSRYAYSVAPWHCGTLLWGRMAGSVLPHNTRILSLLAAEPLMWIPSLSIGLPAFLLALVTLHYSKARSASRFWWLVAVLAGLAMLGNYSPVWLARNFLLLVGQRAWATTLPADETLGFYWLLTELVPTYHSFRYPAKWSVPFALALSLCAAHGLHYFEELRLRVKRYSQAVLILSLLAAIAFGSWSSWSQLSSNVQALPVDPWLGKLSVGDAVNNTLAALVTGAAISACVWLICQRPLRHASAILLLLTAAELLLANRAWLAVVPAPAMHVATSNKMPATRIWAPVGVADIEADLTALSAEPDQRLRTICDYQQVFHLGKLHLLGDQTASPIANLSALTTLPPQSLVQARRALAEIDRLQPSAQELESALAWLGVDQRLIRQPANPSPLSYAPIHSPAPLVSWRDNSQNTLHVKYFGVDRILLDVDAADRSELILRLYQDGGWQARLSGAGQGLEPMTPRPSHLGLFQTVEIPAGQWQIELTYTAPGFTLGMWISGFALLICSILSTFFSQRPLR